MKQEKKYWENLILLDTPWATAPLCQGERGEAIPPKSTEDESSRQPELAMEMFH